MIKVAFLLNYPTTYNGGINYFRNLFFAINKHLKNDIEVYLFVPNNLEAKYINIFNPYAQIIKTDILKRKSPKWILDKISEKLFNKNILLDSLLIKHNIDVVSHSSYVSNKLKTINWIMDFQHVHFPDLWTSNELKATRKFLHRLITKGDSIFLSSNSAFDDFKIEYNSLASKVNILHFVSQPYNALKVKLTDDQKSDLETKYAIKTPYFYLPNQFWSHKNHKVVFEAINLLKRSNYEPLLITSGLMNDFRSKSNHIQQLKNFVTDNGLEKNILFLGLIPYNDVLDLIIQCECLINPSYFEGWSSTVEEGKTMGKRLVLSNIAVHQEQNPEYGIYFDPDDSTMLYDILKKVLNNELEKIDPDLSKMQNNLTARTQKFAQDYLAGIKKLVG